MFEMFYPSYLSSWNYLSLCKKFGMPEQCYCMCSLYTQFEMTELCSNKLLVTTDALLIATVAAANNCRLMPGAWWC